MPLAQFSEVRPYTWAQAWFPSTGAGNTQPWIPNDGFPRFIHSVIATNNDTIDHNLLLLPARNRGQTNLPLYGVVVPAGAGYVSPPVNVLVQLGQLAGFALDSGEGWQATNVEATTAAGTLTLDAYGGTLG